MYIKQLLIVISLLTSAGAKEVSAFEAGNLNSENPYGLTSTEKHILSNQKNLGSIDTKVKTVKSRVQSIDERIDGLESIYEGDSLKLNDTVLKVSTLNKNNDITKIDIENLKKLVSQIMVVQTDIQNENKTNLTNLKKAITKMSVLVNKINKEYISTVELRKNMNQFVTKKEFLALKRSLNKDFNQKVKSKSTKKRVNSREAKKIFLKAKKLFKKTHFTKAIPMFELLIYSRYKPSESNYYLGEMWYHRKKYSKAIGYFKISATLHDKGIWMPKLLLHSAISFENTDDLDNAVNFYTTLVDNYPESKEATEAHKRLLNLD